MRKSISAQVGCSCGRGRRADSVEREEQNRHRTLSSRRHVDGVDVYATIQNKGAVKFAFMHTGVDESSLGAFLTALFEEQAPMV